MSTLELSHCALRPPTKTKHTRYEGEIAESSRQKQEKNLYHFLFSIRSNLAFQTLVKCYLYFTDGVKINFVVISTESFALYSVLVLARTRKSVVIHFFHFATALSTSFRISVYLESWFSNLLCLIFQLYMVNINLAFDYACNCYNIHSTCLVCKLEISNTEDIYLDL